VNVRRLSAYIDALVAGHRPPRFRADPEDIEVLRTAIALRAARPGDAIPDDNFVSALHDELADRERPTPIVELPRMRRGRTILAAVAASLVLIGGTVVATEATNHSPGTTATALAPHIGDVRTGTFLSADDQVVGQIVAYSGRPSWVYMNVDGSNLSGPITCKLQIEDGTTVAVGVFDLHRGQGDFSRTIKVDIGRLRGAKLVNVYGSTVALATFA
jgi:hypothetical protein